MKYRFLLLYFLFTCLSVDAIGQDEEKKANKEGVRVSIIKVTIGYDIPGGDMADRFGNNFEVGAGFLHKTKKNWLWGIDGSFITGSTINERNMLGDLVTSNGTVIGQNGLYADLNLSERGFKLPVVKFGRLFPASLPKANDASGFYAMAGVGFMQHRIRIVDRDNSVPALHGDYQKGYDRMSNGLAIVENLGYMYLSERRLLNFFLAFEFTQAFTKSRRGFNFDTRQYDNDSRLDFLWGIQAGWMFPIYDRPKDNYYYY